MCVGPEVCSRTDGKIYFQRVRLHDSGHLRAIQAISPCRGTEMEVKLVVFANFRRDGFFLL